MKPKHWIIKVTQEEIAKSKKENASQCMVANAVARSIPGSESIDVTADTIRFNLKDKKTDQITRFIYDTTGKVGKRIADFDDGKKVEPFEFKLDARQAFAKPVKLRKPAIKKVQRKASKNTKPCKRKSGLRRPVVRRRHGLKQIA